MKLETVRRFFELCESFSLSEPDYKTLLHPEIEQTEFPNLITPNVTVSNYETLMQRIPNGKKLLKEQKFDIRKSYESGDTLITEVVWTAVVGADLGAFKDGQQLKAYFCCIFDFKDGKIYRQRNYDCFERF
ncbi:nuclear transport factor 2 family protein [Cohnella sp. CFH 77786]|uniref:nuclear transport factor 2 family protein n=1 Tax=Cohnella sp. CFH 77786 TaxID=2662265 RepID=UPI001C608702|nr:nuclear transport factor 2 family protein [Cohnella sp. CFH 77786]MBW5448844.1 nuclear transport factor 2 family protein [Cohnella sp. CFH 77786]